MYTATKILAALSKEIFKLYIRHRFGQLCVINLYLHSHAK